MAQNQHNVSLDFLKGSQVYGFGFAPFRKKLQGDGDGRSHRVVAISPLLLL
jgi:hypothetical protein